MTKKLPSKLDPDFVERAAASLREKAGMTREEFDRLDAKLKSRAFTVAYLETVDRVSKIQEILADAILSGKTLEEFGAEVSRYLQSHPWHVETVLRTNVQSAYGAARWQIAQQLRSVRPYGWYNAMMDGRTRPLHAKLHGKVYPLDHPFWQTYWPPWDYNCRCQVRLLSEDDLRRYNLTPEVAMPDIQPVNDFVSPAVRGIELPAEELLPKLKALSPEAQLAVQARLHEEIAIMERSVAPKLTGTTPTELGQPPSAQYWRVIQHELPPTAPPGAEVSWAPVMTEKQAEEWVKGSVYTSDLYVAASKKQVAAWKKQGLTSLLPDDDMFFGRGIYLSHDAPPSPSPGAEVCKVKVRLTNPYVIEWDGSRANALTAMRGPLGPQLLIELASNPGLTSAQAVTNILERMGHDGVVCRNTATNQKLVVVFDRQQAVIVKTRKLTVEAAPVRREFLEFADAAESDQWAKQVNYSVWASRQLTAEEKEALLAYKEMAYLSINMFLRTGSSSWGVDLSLSEQQLVNYIKNIDSALSKRPLPADLVLYRGAAYAFFEGKAQSPEDLPALVGQVFQDKGYLSCAICRSHAFRGVLLRIRAPRGTPAGYLEILQERAENEMLLARGLKLKVTSVDISGDRPLVNCDVVD